jgi:hypothetical protein
MVLMGNLKHDRPGMNSDGRKAMSLSLKLVLVIDSCVGPAKVVKQ